MCNLGAKESSQEMKKRNNLMVKKFVQSYDREPIYELSWTDSEEESDSNNTSEISNKSRSPRNGTTQGPKSQSKEEFF